LNDIAKKAGVSVSTASRILNNKSEKCRISEKTQLLVETAAQELKYRPNQLARGLRLKKTNTIGLILPDISNPFFAYVARMIQ
ncbi:MAG: LacI family DNA-binding transcriptional regulator, partial [Aliifodinibius sp.]|nr:LacI family transcriptional regulator [Fodinibius sp.]NIV11281.1 LacI family DNA-binding transcriptional regulator [Fodinibius sp.]NIY24895.1 LacI family DNA-binding transcriptional regulator [Fodinibius sp.]